MNVTYLIGNGFGYINLVSILNTKTFIKQYIEDGDRDASEEIRKFKNDKARCWLVVIG